MDDYAYVGEVAYELIYKNDPPVFTDAQAKALAAEYSKLGLLWKKCEWEGYHCVISKATKEAHSQFCQKRSKQWQSIRDRVGYSGLTMALNNRYQPGVTEPDIDFLSGRKWASVVALITEQFAATYQGSSPAPTVLAAVPHLPPATTLSLTKQSFGPASKGRRLAKITIGIGVVAIVCLALGFWVHNDVRKRDIGRIWKDRFDKITVGMTRDEVYSMLGYERRAEFGRVSYISVPERSLPATAKEQRVFFTNKSYLIKLTSKFGHSIGVVYSSTDIVEAKTQERLE